MNLTKFGVNEEEKGFYRSKQLLLLFLVLCNTRAENVSINVAYYELPPFIYRGDNGSLLGILPDIADTMKNRIIEQQNAHGMLDSYVKDYEDNDNGENDGDNNDEDTDKTQGEDHECQRNSGDHAGKRNSDVDEGKGNCHDKREQTLLQKLSVV